MKRFMKIFAVIISILIVMTSAIGCKGNDQPSDTISSEEDSTTKKPKETKKQYTPTIPTDSDEEEDTTIPQQAEETGPIQIGTDNGDFSGAADMH